MRHAYLLPMLLLGLGACDGAPASVAPMPDTDPQLAATVETLLKGRYPIGPRTNFNACTNEWVDIVGEYNLVVRRVTTPGGATKYMIHSVGGHVNGVGQTSGDLYVSNEHFNYIEHYGGSVTTLVIEFGISYVSKGSAPNNEPGKLQIVLVINANGEVVVDRTEIRFECRS